MYSETLSLGITTKKAKGVSEAAMADKVVDKASPEPDALHDLS